LDNILWPNGLGSGVEVCSDMEVSIEVATPIAGWFNGKSEL
jgi:hypothetical protein